MKNLNPSHPHQNLKVKWKHVQDPWMNWNSFQEALFAAHGIIPHTLKVGHPGT
jgi:hypothetical protein